VYGWEGDIEAWDAIPLRDRSVHVAFDSDLRVNKHVRRAAEKLASFLKQRGAKVEFLLFPEGDDGSKVGLDDYLVKGTTVEELFALTADELPSLPDGIDDDREGPARYESTDDGIFSVTAGKEGEIRTRLANFSARIVAELTYVENPDRPREFEVEVKLNGKAVSVFVTATEFERMSWVIELLGAGAIISAGFGVKDEVRAAIQINSDVPRQINAYDRLGWADLHGDGSQWGFIHARGVIVADSQAGNTAAGQNRPDETSMPGTGSRRDGPKRPIPSAVPADAEVRVQHLSPALSLYALPVPPAGDLLKNAIRISLGFLDLAPDRLTVPLYAGMWRVAIDVVRFSLLLVGPSGLGKTELTAALVQHFGAGMDSEHMPESFVSTTYAVASVAHQACNVVLPVDDLVPGGSAGKIQRAHDQADYLIRSQGNRAGRNRCNRDGSTQGGKESRGLYCITGEDSPPGESLGARYLNLEAVPGDILDVDPGDTTKSEKLKLYQNLARQGYPAMAMAGFLRWVAPNYEKYRREMHDEKLVFRDEVFRGKAAHPRVVDIAADLLAGFDLFLFFALEVGAIGEDEHAELWQRSHDALFETLKAQDRHHVEQDPARRLMDLLGSALTTGRAHLVTMSEDDPKYELGSPRLWGYAERTIRIPVKAEPPPGKEGAASTGEPQGAEKEAGEARQEFEEKTVLEPRGDQIGWRLCDNLYFEPERALGVAQRIAWEAGQPPIPLGKKGLGKRLDKLELLASKEPDRNTSRPLIDGKKTDVWHVLSHKFYEFLEPWEKHWSGRRDEEALREQEESLRRKEERERLAELRMRQAAEFVEQGFSKLFDADPVPDDRPAHQVRDEQATAQPPPAAQDGEGPPHIPPPSAREVDGSPQPTPVSDGESSPPPLHPTNVREVGDGTRPGIGEVAVRPVPDDDFLLD